MQRVGRKQGGFRRNWVSAGLVVVFGIVGCDWRPSALTSGSAPVAASAHVSGTTGSGAAAGLSAAVAAGLANSSAELPVVSSVDLRRYMGRWYEYARYPNDWQEGVVDVVVEYTLRDDGRIRAYSTGRKGSFDGDETDTTAVAKVVCRETSAKWQMRFLLVLSADYWIIEVGSNYEYAVVGQPSRDYLWILSRTPTLDADIYRGICERLRRVGYDPERLVRTPHRTAR